MTNEVHVLPLLQEYVDGALTTREMLSVDEHVRSCSACATELHQLQRILRDAAALPKSIAPQRDLWPAVESRIRKPGRIAKVFSLGVRRNGLGATESGSARPGRPQRPAVVRWSVSVAAVIAVGFCGWLIFRSAAREDLPFWQVVSVEGSPIVGSSRIEGTAHIHKGEWLETDASSRAEISVGKIGRVDVGPNTRIHLIEAADDNNRLSLAQGDIRATVSAPPRLFFVETPSALAVDLGCSYALRVDEHGAGILEVTAGYVAFEGGGRQAVVPAGMSCLTRPGSGPGTPFLGDAPDAFRNALERFDFSGNETSALSNVLAAAREEDGITLWHLLFRVHQDERGRVYDRLAALVPSPHGVNREGVLNGNPAMIGDWQDQLGLGPFYTWEFTH